MSLLPRPPLSAALVVDLARIVGPGGVSTLDGDRFAYARDLWPRDLFRIRAGEVPSAPSCVVWPETREEVAKVLELAANAEIPVVPFGAGSGVAGGARPKQGGIALDLKRMRAVRAFDEKNLRAEIEAGVIGERLERSLNDRGYTLGHFPSSILCSTLGGWLAARSAGQASTLYGKIEDMCFGLEVAMPGQILRSMLGPRPGRGPDFNALVIGSEGTFCAITAAELRVRPLPEARVMRGFRFRDVESGLEGIRRMLRAGLRPAVVRLYDALDTFLGRGHGEEDDEASEVRSLEAIATHARGFYDDLVRRFQRKGEGGGSSRLGSLLVRQTVRAVLGAPMLLNKAISALPDDCLLILGFEGQPALVGAEFQAARAIAESVGAEDLGPGPGDHWLKNRYNVSFKASKAWASGAFTDTMEVASTWDRLLPMYKAVKTAIGREAFVMAHFSHAYPEGCSIYFTFAGAAGDPSAPEAVIERYDRLWRTAIAAVHETGGTLSHHHGVGELKAEGMAREHGPGGMRLLAALKAGFDPKDVMNPGKLGFEARPRWVVKPEAKDVPARGLPKEIRAAVGESNLSRAGSRVIVRPPDESGFASVLRVASARGIAVTSDQTGFRAPVGAVQLDTSRLSGIVRLSTHSLFVEAEAGIRIDHLEALVARHGLTLGALHPRAESRSLGAALARGLLVRRGTAFGDLRDLCFAVRGLLASGAPIETRPVPRSATGPELDRALIGGEGRWGIITRATLRLAVDPPHRQSIAFRLPSLTAALEAARLILRRGIKPVAARVLGPGVVLLDLAAHSPERLAAEIAVATTTVESMGGQRAEEATPARGGRFDAVVEVAQLWTRAHETWTALASASGGEVWADFLAPEGLTLVARVVDPASRHRTIEAAQVAQGRVLAGARRLVESEGDDKSADPSEVSEGADDFAAFEGIRSRVDALIDPTGVFRERRSSSE
ncbi:MAG: FAD-binding oxidoreductase [Myxococcota bacterium]